MKIKLFESFVSEREMSYKEIQDEKKRLKEEGKYDSYMGTESQITKFFRSVSSDGSPWAERLSDTTLRVYICSDREACDDLEYLAKEMGLVKQDLNSAGQESSIKKPICESKVSNAKGVYQAAVQYFQDELGTSWVTNHTSGNTPEAVVANLMMQHFMRTEAGKYNKIVNDRTSSAKDKHQALSEEMDFYNELDPPIFTKEQWKGLQDAINAEIEQYMH